MDSQEQYDGEVARLVRMLGSDPAFYLLSLHSFIEMVMNRRIRDMELFVDGIQYSFQDKIYLYRNHLVGDIEKHGSGSTDRNQRKGISHLGSLSKSHHLTNKTRHDFGHVTVEEANAGTWSFLEFCRLSGIESRNLRTLRENLNIWTERETGVENFNELRKIRFAVHLKDLEIQELNRRLVELAEWENKARSLTRELQQRDEQLRELESRAGSRREKIDSLRRERHDLGEELKAVKDRLGQGAELAGYREELLRLSSYTRTRRDFERSIVRLSDEQRAVLDRNDPGAELLVRGGAGTGKTIVLLESLRRLSEQQGLFGDESGQEFALLTYANTLVKYDRYISEILGIADDRLSIQTVDSFIAARFRVLRPHAEIRYDKLLEYIIEDLGDEIELPSWMNVRDLAFEIDQFIWAYRLSPGEYVDEMYSRSGLRQRLDRDRRREIWEIQALVREKLAEQEVFTRNLAVILMLEDLEKTPAESEISSPDRRFSRLYIDEVQDLPPVVLRYLRTLAGRLIMAGDLDQSIYGLQSPFVRAGIDVRGKSYILNQNFRNTIPILELAEKFRSLSGLAEIYDADTEDRKPRAFREGPPVSLCQRSGNEDLLGELTTRLKLFVEVLGYDPGNICIICPDNRQVDAVAAEIRETIGLKAVSIRDPEFSFSRSSEGEDGGDAVCLSPIHSAKGLDFPVVFLYLPFLKGNQWLDDGRREEQKRNLLYVALTRAMDHLEVFITDASARNPTIAALVESWNGSHQAPVTPNS